MDEIVMPTQSKIIQDTHAVDKYKEFISRYAHGAIQGNDPWDIYAQKIAKGDETSEYDLKKEKI